MFNSEALEVAIGMAFLFLAMSLICTAVKEWLEGIFKWRAMDLERALRTLLADPTGEITSQLLNHPLLDSLFAGTYDATKLRPSRLTPGQGAMHMPLRRRRNLPSYIPAGHFAVALLDSIARGPSPARDVRGAPVASDDAASLVNTAVTVDALRASAALLASPQLQRLVLTAVDHSDGDLARVRKNIEQWFDGAMDRASGWYKRRTQALLFLLGISVAVILNVDTFHVMQTLTADKSFRDVVVHQAANVEAPASPASQVQLTRIANARAALNDVGMPIGWRAWSPPAAGSASSAPHARMWPVPMQLCGTHVATSCARDHWLDHDWWLVLCGWLMTAFAVTLGAPFWFDVLNKFMMARSSAKPAATT